jgi:NAD(P)H dehydrogenase (quinone)
MQSTILITGATGSTGRAAIRFLLERNLPVRALVHRDDERSRKLASDGAEVVVGDLLDFRAVRRALEGVQRAYFVYPINPGILQATVQFAQAAREGGVEFIVNISQKSSRREAKSHAALQHWLSEQVFNWSATPVAHLRPTYFAEWLLYMRNMIKEGRMSVPFGTTGRHAPVAAEDQAAVIAAMLADPTGHKGQVYPLFGPVELTAPEIADIVSKTLGKAVRYEKISATQWAREVRGKEAPFLAQHLDEVAIDHHDGIFAGTNDVIETITGRRPMTVAEFVEQHRSAFE